MLGFWVMETYYSSHFKISYKATKWTELFWVRVQWQEIKEILTVRIP
jgi:hypothetical protein